MGYQGEARDCPTCCDDGKKGNGLAPKTDSVSDDCRTRICKNGCMYPQTCPHEPQSYAHFGEVISLLTELTEWRQAALKLGLYVAGTDVSTPAKWATAQLDVYERLHVPPFGKPVTPMEVAITQCGGMAAMIDVWAGRATEQHHQNGQYGKWCYDSEVLRLAAHLLKRYTESKTSPSWTTACGDCDPCLGGRPDQCAVMAKGKL